MQILRGPILHIGVQIGVYQRQGLGRIQIDVGVFPRIGQGGEIDLVHTHFQNLSAQPCKVSNGEVRVHILVENFGVVVDFGEDIACGEHLFRHGLQELLLGGHAAQILAAVAAAVVIMAESHHPQGVGAAQMLDALFEVDAEVLDGVVIVHIDGDIEIHAADGIHQRGKALRLTLTV